METNPKFETLELAVAPDVTIKAVLGIPEWWPSGHRVGMAVAHDVGANIDHDSVVWLQRELVDRGYLTIRFNFPFAEQGRKRPDPLPLLEKAFRAAISGLMRDPSECPAQLVLAGYGIGAKVASQILAQGVKCDGLVSLGYPLHPAGKPSQLKAESLFRVICPILFVQGTRDAHCRVDRLQELMKRIGAPTQLVTIEDADHEFVPVRRATHTPEDVRAEILTAVETFVRRTTGAT